MSNGPSYKIAVRALCEFTAKSGDLDLRFTPSPSAQEGIAGHTLVTSRRAESYQREVTLVGQYQELEIKGRADGYDPVQNRLEEIKTFRGDVALIPAHHRALHWAQAKCYGWLLCQDRSLEQIELALVYFDIVKQKETSLCEVFSGDELRLFFEQQCEDFLQWARQEMAHKEARDQAMEYLSFPHKEFRTGQRILAESVYQTAVTHRCLLAEAPTGIGKTLGTLFPLLKTLPRKSLDKIIFLTAKTPGRQLALDALNGLSTGSLRTLELVAREKSCEHPDKACHGESCPLAQGFYDRLPAARQAAAQETMLTQNRLRELALEQGICPYYLSQEMARWSDVIIGDYNYYFDSSAMLHTLAAANQWRVAMLVDEAHNLVDRARAMYSAELNQQQFRRVKRQLPVALKGAFDKLNRQWNGLNRAHASADYHVIPELPVKLLFALQGTAATITDYLTEQPFALSSELMQFYFDALHFLRVAELFDRKTFLFDITRQNSSNARTGSILCFRNLVPAALLRKRFETSQTTTLFSATLKPMHYYRDLLGLPENTQAIEVPSPFSSNQLTIHVASHISTRYQERARSIGPIAQLIAEQFGERPGNYLAFFSSYAYLEQVLERLRRDYPKLSVWAQERDMDEKARAVFLNQFREEGEGVGFAVLGGAFAEGIDLPGNRLIGAFIATLGLPQTNPINEQLKQRMQELFGDGYNYTYLYPGLRKVVQAAGRVIRTETDRGVIVLIDDRFTQPRVQALLPDWWNLSS